MKNHLLVLEALKALYAKDIFINYHIYGPVKDEKYWQACSRATDALPTNILVHYHNDVVPHKVEDALHAGHVFILPSKSENFGHAIYEALSAGKPVITSGATPWNGLLEAKAGVNINPENLEELSQAISHFVGMDKDELEAWSQGAKTYSEKGIDLEKIKQQYKRLFALEN